MSRTLQHEAWKRERQANRVEADLARAKRNAELAEIFTEGVRSRFWQALQAEITSRREQFEKGALGMRRDRFEEEQGALRGMLELEKMVTSRVGKRDQYLNEARELQELLDAAVTAGRIAPRG